MENGKVENGGMSAFPVYASGDGYPSGLTKRELFAMVFTHALIAGGSLESASSEDMARFGIHQAKEFLDMLETKKKEDKREEELLIKEEGYEAPKTTNFNCF